MDSIWRKTLSSSRVSTVDEVETKQVDMMDLYLEEGGERASASSLMYVSVNVLEEFQQAKLVHGNDEGTFDIMDNFSGFVAGEGEEGHSQ
jgi:hypothetical protein